MAKVTEIQSVLEQMLAVEKKAEANCGLLLSMLHENGYPDMVEKIKNDEVHHQQMVEDLLEMLG